MQVRKEIRVTGVVQGVGFRPYVYRLATDRHLSGNIINTPAGVTIEVQGPQDRIEDFVSRLPAEAPALAQVATLQVRELPCATGESFRILSSRTGSHASALISPDIAICDDCLRELFDPHDRRYLYPFINCTNCGPRFTIVRDIPYDRARTSMAVFRMCAACRAEYEDPRNRRFHAQPNACWECGPQAQFWSPTGQPLETSKAIETAAEYIHAEKIVAIKGLGGFHLAVDAQNSLAVQELRRRKRRWEKPLALMVRNLEAASELCCIDPQSWELLASRQRPIVLLPRKTTAPVSEAVAPGQSELGLFLPYTPLHHLLFTAGKFPALVMTSGNLSDEPIAIENREAVRRLQNVCDGFLVHDREILLRSDDSVLRCAAGRPRQFRRSRGYVPVPLSLHREVPPILAVGGELKNTICLTRGNLAFLSQHVGDLENAESFSFFREAVSHLTRILEIQPEIIAYDLHPGYFSTKWALEQAGARLVGVQHHHAHIASCMAENRVQDNVIGIALDGTGYGTDGQIWGGEAFIGGYEGFQRKAHFAYVPLPGGEAAVRQPWRMALSYLAQTHGEGVFKLRIPFMQNLDRAKARLVLAMIKQGVNTCFTSSCGRLFDAVAALIGIRQEVHYEAQAAMELETAARAAVDSEGYPLRLARRSGGWEIETGPLFDAMVRDLQMNVSVESISRRFHNGLVLALLRLACVLRDEFFLNRICLSGGSFNNLILFENLLRALESAGFEVFTHSQVPAGDGGLSLGQALIAASRDRQQCSITPS
jgi:hydrogenase maturation protein HypF